jgi:hypothetical protein
MMTWEWRANLTFTLGDCLYLIKNKKRNLLNL